MAQPFFKIAPDVGDTWEEARYESAPITGYFDDRFWLNTDDPVQDHDWYSLDLAPGTHQISVLPDYTRVDRGDGLGPLLYTETALNSAVLYEKVVDPDGTERMQYVQGLTHRSDTLLASTYSVDESWPPYFLSDTVTLLGSRQDSPDSPLYTGEYYLEVYGYAYPSILNSYPEIGDDDYTAHAGRYLITTGSPSGQRSSAWGGWVEVYSVVPEPTPEDEEAQEQALEQKLEEIDTGISEVLAEDQRAVDRAAIEYQRAKDDLENAKMRVDSLNQQITAGDALAVVKGLQVAGSWALAYLKATPPGRLIVVTEEFVSLLGKTDIAVNAGAALDEVIKNPTKWESWVGVGKSITNIVTEYKDYKGLLGKVFEAVDVAASTAKYLEETGGWLKERDGHKEQIENAIRLQKDLEQKIQQYEQFSAPDGAGVSSSFDDHSYTVTGPQASVTLMLKEGDVSMAHVATTASIAGSRLSGREPDAWTASIETAAVDPATQAQVYMLVADGQEVIVPIGVSAVMVDGTGSLNDTLWLEWENSSTSFDTYLYFMNYFEFSNSDGNEVTAVGVDNIVFVDSVITSGSWSLFEYGTQTNIYSIWSNDASTTLVGNSAANSIIGNDADNLIDGGAGADYMYGGLGNDVYRVDDEGDDVDDWEGEGRDRVIASTNFWLEGYDEIEELFAADGAVPLTLVGNDFANFIVGNDGENTLIGEGSDDTFRGLGHFDFMDGGAGTDRALFGELTASVKVTLSGSEMADVRIGGVRSDIIVNIEDFVSGSGNDTLVGDSFNNALIANGGNDTLKGMGGDDFLDGGIGIDTAFYDDKGTGISVALNGSNNVTVAVGGVAEDIIRGIENIVGGIGNDTLIGDGLANALSGGSGADTLRGKAGADILDGGLGADTADYSDKVQSVSVTLAGGLAATVLVGGVAEDTIRNFENLIGGSAQDWLTGDGQANVIRGGGGADVLVGGGGNDTADYFEKTAPVVVTLAGSGNVQVQVNGVIEDTIGGFENVTGGSLGDSFTGDGLANVFIGNGGDDTFRGAVGADVLDGGAGLDTALYGEKTGAVAVTLDGANNAVVTIGGVAEDTLRNVENVVGGSAGDTLTGDQFDNVFNGRGGVDLLDGKGGIDTADYSEKTAALVVTLNGASNATITVGGAAEDTIRNIENIIGGSVSDTLTGDGLANVFRGMAGADVLNGGAGLDTADYSEKTLAVVATLNLSTNATVTVGGAAEDTIRNIENLIGGSAGDTLTGDSLANVLAGRKGNDTLNGGAGIDTADYSEKQVAVTVTLAGAANATVNVGGVAEDTIRNIENLTGGWGADSLTGDSLANTLIGNAGNDTLRGMAGADILDGGAGSDTALYGDKALAVAVTLNGAANATVTVGGVAEDTIRNVENVVGGGAGDTLAGDGLANTLLGNGGNDFLRGLGGADVLDGGVGIDTALYGDKTLAVVVTLNGTGNAVVTVGGVAEDTIRNIENVVGGSAGDTLTGDALANALTGNGGADTLRGMGGADILDGGAGIDIALYGEKTAAVSVTLNGATDAIVRIGGVAEDTIRNVENVSGSDAGDTLAGDTLANTLLGKGGNDSLRGLGGSDVLDGGTGVDTAFYGEKSQVIEVTLNGSEDAVVMVGGVAEDTIRNVENVVGGSNADALIGDYLANVLTGNGGNDLLDGGYGADELIGGAGQDSFLFKNIAYEPDDLTQIDRISDFNVFDDTILLDSYAFGALGDNVPLAANNFRIGAAAVDADDYIIYNSATGALSYDTNGNLDGGVIRFATLAPSLALTSADFFIA